MGLLDKIKKALQEPLCAEYVRLDDDDGISGFVVSSRFEGISSLDRQQMIDDALQDATASLSQEERQHILMIAGLTPLEYDSVGAKIRVHQIREQDDSSLEVMLRGNLSDAKYVRDVLENLEGVTTTEPGWSPGAKGILMEFRAEGTDANPLTKEKVIRELRADQYIEVIEKKQQSVG